MSSNLDRILDRVTPRHEVTIDAADLTQADFERVRDTAEARGLHVSGTRRWILIRTPPRYSH